MPIAEPETQMRNTPLLLDKARKMCVPPTDYQLAKRLDVSPQRLSNWRRQDSAPDNEAAWKLAKLLGMPVLDVIAYIEEDKAKDDHKREFWRRQLPRPLPSIAIAGAGLLALGGTLIGGHHGGAAAIAASNIAFLQPIYYAKYMVQLGAALYLLGTLKTLTRSPPIASAAAQPA